MFLKNITETFSEGVLTLMANAGVVIPYFFCLMLYQSDPNNFALKLPFLTVYVFRAIGMLLTVYIANSAKRMLIVSNVFGVLGSLLLLGASNPFLGISGGILLGLASSWIWPYFLTIKTKGKLDQDFYLTKYHWGSAILIMTFLELGEYLSIKMSAVQWSFIILMILFGLSLVGSITMSNKVSFYNDSPKVKIHIHKRIFGGLVLIVLGMLLFAVRYTRLHSVPRNFDLILCGIAIVILGFSIYFQIDIHKRLFPLSLAALNRGIVMNFVMLYAIFDSTVRFSFNTLMLVYILYIIGFQFGPIILKKHQEWRYPLLLIGLVLTLFNPTYFVGILFCSLFVGSDNVILNKDLYNSPKLNPERSFLVKYQLSSMGNVTQQLIYMTIIYFVSYFLKINALDFFSTKAGAVNVNVVYLIHVVITIGVLVSSGLTLFFNRKYASQK